MSDRTSKQSKGSQIIKKSSTLPFKHGSWTKSEESRLLLLTCSITQFTMKIWDQVAFDFCESIGSDDDEETGKRSANQLRHRYQRLKLLESRKNNVENDGEESKSEIEIDLYSIASSPTKQASMILVSMKSASLTPTTSKRPFSPITPETPILQKNKKSKLE